MKVALRIPNLRRRSMPGADEVRTLLERVIAQRCDLKRVHQRKSRPALEEGRLVESVQLCELDTVRARALLAWLDLEADPLAARERGEVDGRIEAGAVEEILPPVLGGNEPEPAVGDQLLDGACRHLPTPFSKAMSRTHGPFELSLIHISEPTRLGMISY